MMKRRERTRDMQDIRIGVGREGGVYANDRASGGADGGDLSLIPSSSYYYYYYYTFGEGDGAIRCGDTPDIGGDDRDSIDEIISCLHGDRTLVVVVVN